MGDEELRRQFADCREAFGDAGIFGDDTAAMTNGLTAFDKPTTKPTKDGVVISTQCRNCGAPWEVMHSYPELVCVWQMHPANDIIQGAPEWRFSQENGAWFAMLKCRCQTPVVPLVTPPEAQALVQRAVQQQWIHPQAVQQIVQAINGRKQQLQGGAPQQMMR